MSNRRYIFKLVAMLDFWDVHQEKRHGNQKSSPIFSEVHLRSLTVCSLNHGAWKTILSYWVLVTFQELCLNFGRIYTVNIYIYTYTYTYIYINTLYMIYTPYPPNETPHLCPTIFTFDGFPVGPCFAAPGPQNQLLGGLRKRPRLVRSNRFGWQMTCSGTCRQGIHFLSKNAFLRDHNLKRLQPVSNTQSSLQPTCFLSCLILWIPISKKVQ